MAKSTKQILIDARKLIEKPENWIQGDFKNENGICATQSLFQSGVNSEGWFANHPAYRALRNAMGGVNQVCAYNDTHTHAEVLAAFDKAIEEAL